jgi:tetratricopeptide (TPR) repeat protein
MYSTDQFRIFSGGPADRILSRPRRLLQEGRLEEAEAAYRTALELQPDLRATWTECFALLRHAGRHGEALAFADRAAEQFGDDALPAVLRGAALVELGRFREGLEMLDEAARKDPDSGLVWHEAGYAAWRLGELSRALMALDRAFALEPHGGTLHLRGLVLRQAGRYLAAEVAFEGASQAAEFPPQRERAEREIQVTRRYAAFPGSRPETLPPMRRWFAETGSVPLTGHLGEPATDEVLAAGVAALSGDLGWRFSVLVALDAWPGWYDLAKTLGVPVSDSYPQDPTAVPIVAARHPAVVREWERQAVQPRERGRGLSLALHHPPQLTPADLTGHLIGPAPRGLDPAFAVEAAQHPEGLLRDRALTNVRQSAAG